MSNQALTIPEQTLNEMNILLRKAMEIHSPIYGTVQIYNPITQYLQLVLQNVETDFFKEHLINVNTRGNSVCSRALRNASNIMIADIESDSFFKEIINAGLKLDFKALHCTPIFGSHREVLGILTTHFDKSIYLTDSEVTALELLAAKLALLIQKPVNQSYQAKAQVNSQ